MSRAVTGPCLFLSHFRGWHFLLDRRDERGEEGDNMFLLQCLHLYNKSVWVSIRQVSMYRQNNESKFHLQQYHCSYATNKGYYALGSVHKWWHTHTTQNETPIRLVTHVTAIGTTPFATWPNPQSILVYKWTQAPSEIFYILKASARRRSHDDLPDDAAIAGVGCRVAGLKGLVEADLRLVLGAHLSGTLVVVLHVRVWHATYISICVGKYD